MKIVKLVIKIVAKFYHKYRKEQSERRAGFTAESTLTAYRMENTLTYDMKKHYCERKAYAQIGYFPNLDNPKTYNEKILWLALNYKNPRISVCVDKYEMKKYVKEKVGDGFCVPTLGVYSNINDIPFDNLPDNVVFKSTAGWSGKQVILFKRGGTEEADRIKSIMSSWLYPWNTYYYNNLCITDEKITPRIIIEEMIGDGRFLTDYKVYCFNGKPEMLLIIQGRGRKEYRTFIRIRDWTVLPFKRKVGKINMSVDKPAKLEQIIEIATKLSEGFPLVRIDFYIENGHLFVGEMTFSPGLFLGINPREWDTKLGDLLDIDKYINKEKSKRNEENDQKVCG